MQPHLNITNQANMRLLIVVVIVLLSSWCHSDDKPVKQKQATGIVTTGHHIENDPLDDEFYNEETTTPLERIENIVTLGVKKIEEGVKNTEPLTDIQTKQAVLEAKQEYLEEGLLRNSSRIDSHANLLKQVSITLEGATHAITNLKDRWNWWYTALSSILTGVAGASVTWFMKGRTKKNEVL